ncbi:glycosyltransferase [Candidatus Woesearchaeota archaeon]|nr:glycosyltransferase [Candidatus Woesearchaeota archaeon]
MNPNASYLFEVSWEVCNKVGGIYTVVKTKAGLLNKLYPQYYLIGPYFEDKAKVEMNECPAPAFCQEAVSVLKQQGIRCYFGKWQVRGEPSVILIDFHGLLPQKDAIKRKLWDTYQIDSLHTGWDFEEPMLWAWAVGMFLELVAPQLKGKPSVVHTHEWLSGFTLLYVKMQKLPFATVFTTHATMLGRTLASASDLYTILPTIDPTREAYAHGIQAKFTTEKACAQQADIFTTVSETTALEAEKILGRKPEVLVLNGLDFEKFFTFEEAAIAHRRNREKIREFLSYFFFPYYTFDLDHTLAFFIVGRYEFRNKGIDIFIKALGKLNQSLKKSQPEGTPERTIVVFFWIPQETFGIKTELLESKTFYKHIKDFVVRSGEDMETDIIQAIVSRKELSEGIIFSNEFKLKNKRHLLSFIKNGNPPFCTHRIDHEENDTIIRQFKQEGLLNRQEDTVKVILYPVYLTGVDGLLDLPYYDAMSGCHLGVFPSYYEPWGYTPLESAALSVPAITSDLSGFGKFIAPFVQGESNSGIFVLPRENKSEEEVIENFTKLLEQYALLDRHERVKNKINANIFSARADWNILIAHYIRAHNLAIERKCQN